MNGQHVIDNSQYPLDFFDPMTIPVEEEKLRPNLQLSTNLSSRLRPGTSFAFSMDEAIITAERHMFIFDSATSAHLTNPVKIVNDWVNLVRWEVSTFWKIYRGSNNEIDHTDDTRIHYTHEHPKRVGEVLAEGISLLFLEDRLGCPPQCFWFFKGSKSRPDFIANTNLLGVGMMINGIPYGVEVRCRKSQANLHGRDEKDLVGKKQANPTMSNIIGIYFFYGRGHHPSNYQAKTRLHLADPEREGRQLHDYERAWVIINHYLGVVSRIGLREHRKYLEKSLLLASRGKIPKIHFKESFERIGNETLSSPLTDNQHWQGFVGNGYNTLAEQAQTIAENPEKNHLIQRELQAKLDAGLLGYHVYRGLRNKVLDLIEHAKWRKLEKYRDPDSGRYNAYGLAISADGVLTQVAPIINRETPQAREVILHMRELGYKV